MKSFVSEYVCFGVVVRVRGVCCCEGEGEQYGEVRRGHGSSFWVVGVRGNVVH